MKNYKSLQIPLAFLLIVFAMLACKQFTARPIVTPISPTTTKTVSTAVSTIVPVEPADANAGSPGLGDSLYPDFGNGGYDVTHYTLDITVNDVAKSDLTAMTTIEAKATQNLSSFDLDFIGFEISDITVNGETAKFSRKGQELTIHPLKSLAKNETFTVAVKYKGVPQVMQSVALPVQTGWITFDGGSYVLSEPDGSANYYPANDHPLDKATYTFHVTVPKPWEVAANGNLTKTTDNGNTTTFVFETRDPMASYLATIDIDKFDTETMKSENGIPIRNYYATDLSLDVRKPFARQGEMLTYFSKLFGPYPFDVYGALIMNTDFGSALENQTMSIFGIDMIDVKDVKTTELTVAHELAHQWFGDSVSVADWSDIWLNEGFADYSEGLWIEHTDGRAALDEWVKSQYADIVKSPQFYPPPGSPPANNLFNEGVYVRGGLTLHALRLEVGDETFFKILQTYFERYKGGNATTDDFIAVAQEVSGKDLKNLMDSWLYNEKLPSMLALGLGK